MSVRGGAASALFRAPQLANMARCLASVFAGLGLTACDAEFLADAPAGICTEVGSQCVLPNGPLGVCERSTCPPTASEPCFACVSQH